MSTIYYKATRPDGTDFRTGTVDYAAHLASGEWLPELPELDGPENRLVCSSSVYHASDQAAETLIGGEWPCRLFEVEGEPVATGHGHKFGFATLKVVREIEPWQALGPNGVRAVALLGKIERLTMDQARTLAAAHNAVWRILRLGDPSMAIARSRAAARAAGRLNGLDAARYAAGNLARLSMLRLSRTSGWDYSVSHLIVAEAAREAMRGVIVKGLIRHEDYVLLTAAWGEAVSAL